MKNKLIKIMIFFSIMIFLTSAITTTSANISAINILQNPGFTNWTDSLPDDWTTWLGGTMGALDETIDVQDGDGHAIGFTGATSAIDYAQLRQTITSSGYSEGDAATFTVWFKQSIDCSISITLYWIANNGTEVANRGKIDGGEINTWTELSISEPVPSYPVPINQARVVINSQNAISATVLFDNATLGGDIEFISEFSSLVPIIISLAPMIIATIIFRKKKEF